MAMQSHDTIWIKYMCALKRIQSFVIIFLNNSRILVSEQFARTETVLVCSTAAVPNGNIAEQHKLVLSHCWASTDTQNWDSGNLYCVSTGPVVNFHLGYLILTLKTCVFVLKFDFFFYKFKIV